MQDFIVTEEFLFTGVDDATEHTAHTAGDTISTVKSSET